MGPLKELNLNSNSIRIAGLKTLFRSVPVTLTSLSLVNCGLGDGECNVIRRKIPTNIRKLDLMKNRIGRNQRLGMIDLLSCSGNRLVVIFLDGNPGADKNVMKRLGEAVA